MRAIAVDLEIMEKTSSLLAVTDFNVQNNEDRIN